MKEARRQGTRIGGVGGSGLPNIFHRQSPLVSRKSMELSDQQRPSSPNSSIVKQGLKRAATIVGRRKNASTFDEDRSRKTPLNRSSSLFYNDHNQNGVDVTTIFIRPDRDYPPLQFDNKTSVEILQMLRDEIMELNSMIMPVSTGSGTVNMTVRLTVIIVIIYTYTVLL